MKRQRTLDITYVRSRLRYNKRTGVFTWKHNPKGCLEWNNRWVGKQAGAVSPRYKYISIGIDGILYRANRLAWAMVTGRWPENDVDHRNRIRNDNRFSNLREATRTQNAYNASGHGVSGLKGARLTGSKWTSEIRHNGKSEYLGRFSTAKLAHAAYCAAAKKYHGDFARTK